MCTHSFLQNTTFFLHIFTARSFLFSLLQPHGYIIQTLGVTESDSTPSLTSILAILPQSKSRIGMLQRRESLSKPKRLHSSTRLVRNHLPLIYGSGNFSRPTTTSLRLIKETKISKTISGFQDEQQQERSRRLFAPPAKRPRPPCRPCRPCRPNPVRTSRLVSHSQSNFYIIL